MDDRCDRVGNCVFFTCKIRSFHQSGKMHYNFFPLKYPVYILYLTWLSHAKRVRRPKGLKAISQISQNHTSLSLVCSRPDGKREWNDAFSRDLRDSRETKSCVKREYFIMRFPCFTNISSCLLASIHVDCHEHSREWWRAYARMDANRHTKHRLKTGKRFILQAQWKSYKSAT